MNSKKGSVSHFQKWLSQDSARPNHLPHWEKFIKAFIENKDNKSEPVIELVFTWEETREEFNRYLSWLEEYDNDMEEVEIVDFDALIFIGEQQEFNQYLDYLFHQKEIYQLLESKLKLVKQKLLAWSELGRNFKRKKD